MKRKINWEKVIGWFVFITLLLSVGYSLFGIVHSADDAAARSDYILMMVQCLLGLFVLALPGFLEKRFAIDIPYFMTVLYFAFLYCAIYLGEVRSFYYLIPYWDTILHAMSGAMLGAFGFVLVRTLTEAEKVKVQLSPFFVSLIAFCFAVTIGVVWEIYEFAGDGLLGLNMQKFRLPDGTILSGHDALSDTMWDLIVDAMAAFAISLFGYLVLTAKGKKEKLTEKKKKQ